MTLAVVTTLWLVFSVAAFAAGPAASDASIPTFRVTSAEVHITFTAVGEKNRTVTNLSRNDLSLLQDGRPVDRVTLVAYREIPLSVLVLTDVSDSMTKGLTLERAAGDWLRANSDASSDRISFVDFGSDVEPRNDAKAPNPHLTSLYDVLLESLSRLTFNGPGRRALVVFTDGVDNYSYHSLTDVIAAAQRFDVAIYAITAHPGKKQFYERELLQRTCEATGGRYYDVRKSDAMLRAMARIKSELQNGYQLVFRPGPSSAGMHRVSLQSNQRGVRFFYRSAYFQPAAPTQQSASAR